MSNAQDVLQTIVKMACRLPRVHYQTPMTKYKYQHRSMLHEKKYWPYQRFWRFECRIYRKNSAKRYLYLCTVILISNTRVEPLLPAAEHSPAAAGVVLLLAAVV